MIKVQSGDEVVMRLVDGEDLLESLASLGITAGQAWGIGMLREVRLGYWTGSSYEEHRVDEPVELLSLQCILSQKEGKPFPHCHAVLMKRDGTVVGGHLLGAKVHTSGEIYANRVKGIVLERVREPSGLWGLQPKAAG